MAKVQAARFEPSFWDAVYDRYVNSGVEKVHLFAQRDSFGDVVFTKSSLDKSRAVGIDCSFASLIIIKNSLKELTHVDKHQILEGLCDRLYGAIRNGTAILNPSFVLPSAILAYVDVKKFKYHFWSCCLTARIPRGVKPLTGPVEPLSRDRIVSIYVALARFVLMHQQECSDFAWGNETRALLLPPIMGLRKKSIVGEGEAGSTEWEAHLLEEIWDARYDPDVYLVLSGGNEKGHAELPAYASNVLALLWHTRDITGVGAENEKGEDWEGHTETKEDPLAAAEDIHRQGLSTTSAVSEGKVVKLVCLRGKIIDALWDSGVGADEQRQVAQAKYLIRVLEPEQQQVSLGDRSIVHSFRLEDLEETAEVFEQCKAYLKVAACPGANAQAVMTAKEQEHYSHFDVDKYSDLVTAVENLLQGDLALRSACDRRDCAIPQANKGTIGDRELVRAWNDVAKAERALLEAHETVASEVDRALERPDADSLQLERKEARGWDFEGDPTRCSALQPTSVDLGSDRSPELLLTQASQLNLSLMKWREWPQLRLEELQKRSCLLLGSGTLGCAVARCLLAWGFGSITLIDNGRVSFSNPTRQSLFQLDDCYGGERDLPQGSSGGADVNYGGGGSETLGKLKAAAARDALHRIDPNADVHGIELEIPSPGCLQGVSTDRIHAATGEVVTSTLQLMHFVATNDIIFSLLDTREARWLPTMLTAAAVATEESKLMITAAIGFDSYLVMRHSGNTDEDLGCYFCSDITSGGGGTPPSERPLDQQCSVTRPGLSGIVGGLAVEMAVQIVQARARQDGQHDDRSSDAMSEIPHQIRGSLRDWNQTCHTVPRFNKCIACSQGVVQNFLGGGAPPSAGGDAHSRVLSSRVDFVTAVCRDPQVLPDISGLDGLLREAEQEMSSVLLDSDND